MTRELGIPESALDRSASDARPLYQQLYVRLRESILSGALRPGQRLASSRAMASQLAVARNTVLLTYGRLETEGYVHARHGSGHYVSQLLPHSSPQSQWARRRTPASREQTLPAPVRNSFDFVPPSLRRLLPPVPFRVNHPALDLFPLDTWTRLQTRILREARGRADVSTLLGETDAQGDLGLRRAIAEHVSIARGVRCSADTIVVTAGAQHAIDMLFRVLTVPGDLIGLEDPCFPGALSAARAAAVASPPCRSTRLASTSIAGLLGPRAPRRRWDKSLPSYLLEPRCDISIWLAIRHLNLALTCGGKPETRWRARSKTCRYVVSRERGSRRYATLMEGIEEPLKA